MHELVIILKKEYASEKENFISLLRDGNHGNEFLPNRKFNISKDETLPYSKRQFVLSGGLDINEIELIKKHEYVENVGNMTSSDDYIETAVVEQVMTTRRDRGSSGMTAAISQGSWGLYRHSEEANDWTPFNTVVERDVTYTFDDNELGEGVDLVIQDSGLVNPNLIAFFNYVSPNDPPSSRPQGSRVVKYQWHELFPDPNSEHGFINIYSGTARTQFQQTGKLNYDDSRLHGDHANKVADCAAGNNRGFARKAAIYSMPFNLVNNPYTFDAIRLFHKKKVEAGNTRPTIVNASWGSILVPRNVTSYYFRGTHFTNPIHFTSWMSENAFSGRGLPAGKTVDGIQGSMNNRGGHNGKFGYTGGSAGGIIRYIPWHEPLLVSLTEDLTDEGVIYVVAAGNTGQKTAEVGDMDFNNFITRGSFFSPPRDGNNLLGLPIFINRGSGNKSFDSVVVGALDSQVFNDALSGSNLENKSHFSECGSRIDTFAAGVDVPANNRTGGVSYVNGTSFSSPFVAGMTAILAGMYPGFTPRQARSYWKNIGKSTNSLYDPTSFPRQNPHRSQTVNVSGDPLYFIPGRPGTGPNYDQGTNYAAPGNMFTRFFKYGLLDAPANIAYLNKTIDPRTIVDEGTGLISLSTYTDPTIANPITKRTYTPSVLYKPTQAYRYYKIQFFTNVGRSTPERYSYCGLNLFDEQGNNVFGEPLPDFGINDFVSQEDGYDKKVIFEEDTQDGNVGTVFFQRNINGVDYTIKLKSAFNKTYVPPVGDPDRDPILNDSVQGYLYTPHKFFTGKIGAEGLGQLFITESDSETKKNKNSTVEVDIGRPVKLGSISHLGPRNSQRRLIQRSEFFDISGSNDPDFITGVEKIGEYNFGLHLGNSQFLECITDADGLPPSPTTTTPPPPEPVPEPAPPVPDPDDPGNPEPPRVDEPLPPYPGYYDPETVESIDAFDFGYPILLIDPIKQEPELRNFTPEEDNLTQGINKTIPSRVEELSPKIKRNFIIATVGGIKGLICNKIEGALNLAIGIKNGSFNFIPKLKDFNLNTFFEGPLQGVSNKINNVVADFENISQSLKNNEKLLNDINIKELNDIESQNIERFEATQLTNLSFDNTIQSIQNISNRTVRDIENDPLKKDSLTDKLCESAEFELINNALVAKSVISIAKEQEDLIKKSKNLVDKNKLVEQTSKIERSLLP